MNELYFTDDQSIAAYLCARGYTLLGSVDSGKYDHNGKLRLQFAITHVGLRGDPNKMTKDILDKIEEFSTSFLFPEAEDDRKVSFRDYYIKLRMVKKSLHDPVKKSQVENV